jgi:hypothetical protein
VWLTLTVLKFLDGITMSRRTRRLVTIALVSGLGLLSAGVAYAAWTANGTGTAAAQSDKAQELAAAKVTVSPDTQLVPGGSADVVVAVKNKNPYWVRITAVHFGQIDVKGDDDKAGCTADNAQVSFVDQADTAFYAAPDSTTEFHIPGAVTMGIDSANECQKTVFLSTAELTAQSAPSPTPTA